MPRFPKRPAADEPDELELSPLATLLRLPTLAEAHLPRHCAWWRPHEWGPFGELEWDRHQGYQTRHCMRCHQADIVAIAARPVSAGHPYGP